MIKILIVEDEWEIANIVSENLKRRGYSTSWSSTGVEGLNDFKNGHYDLVIADIMMPDMDGYTLCKKLRAISTVPILIVSARNTDQDKIKGLKLGADDYITKPFSMAELEARIESNLRRYKNYSNTLPEEDIDNIMHFTGKLEINKEARQVVLDNNVLQLTTTEFDILLLMSSSPNKVFTKKAVYEHIWNQADTAGNNAVAVHIKSLRLKLHDDVKKPTFIETVWGTGYKFIGERLK